MWSTILGGLISTLLLIPVTASPLAVNSLEPRWTSTNPYVTVEGNVCTVKRVGACEDDGPNLLYAFNELCSEWAEIKLHGYYSVNTVLSTYVSNVDVDFTGVVNYVPDIKYWSPASIFMTYDNATTFWFFSGENVTVHGGGTIDGNGQAWWDQYALDPLFGAGGGSTREFARPIPFTIGNASDIKIHGLDVINSPFWTIFLYQSNNVELGNIRIHSVSSNSSAPAANTDGIDIYRTSNIHIYDVHIRNDDDCISPKSNTTNVLIENVVCNGSHGISIGSLGQYYGETDIVSDVYVRNITMINSYWGVRIKVYAGTNNTQSVSGGGTGYVRNITFEDIDNQNVEYPIYITQCYNSPADQCTTFPSTLSISDVHYINNYGVASGVAPNGTVVSLQCSAECTDITARGTSLTVKDGVTPKYLCQNIEDESELDFLCSPYGTGTGERY